jgi:hypothetical protein
MAGSTSLAARPDVTVKRTNGYIGAIAMDGSRIAYDVKRALQGPECNRLFVWDVNTGRTVLVSGRGTCSADDTSTGAGVSQIAVARSRIAWLVNWGGNSESSDELFTASLSRAREARIASALRTGNVDCVLEGTEIGGLVGDGDLIAVNMWRRVRSSGGQCATRVTQASLRLIEGTSTRPIATGASAWLARSSDLARVAVHRADASVAIFSRSGSLLREVKPSSVSEVVLRKDYLVVLTRAQTLEIFNAVTGARLFTRRVPLETARLDVDSGLAVYAVGRRVHAMNLRTGRSAVVATAPRRVIGLALEAPGAVYAFDSPYRQRREIGNVVFRPFRLLRAAVS